MSPRKNSFGVPGLAFDKANKTYIWRNKYASKPARWSADKYTLEQVKKEAEQLNKVAQLREALAKQKSQQPPTVSDVIELYIDSEIPRQPWKAKTKKNNTAMLRRFQREFGNRTFATTGRGFLGEWLDGIQGKADTYNGYRLLLIKLWKYAITKEICDYNEAEGTPERSMSPMIKGNQKDRKPFGTNLDAALSAFWQVHRTAPDWVQVAMEFQLLTCQARQETCNASVKDWRDGYLYIIRGKTAHQTDLAFIKIPVTDSLETVLTRGRSLRPISPYFVSTQPGKIKLEALAKKPHPCWVNPEHYGKTFSKLRNRTELYSHLTPSHRPGTHEIRALAGKLLESQGIDPQPYYGHRSRRTTEIYVNTPGLLKDSDFIEVSPGVDLRLIK